MTTATEQFSQASRSSQVRQFAETVRSSQDGLARMTAGQRVAQFGFSSIEDSVVPVFDALGQARMLIGRQTDGNFAVTYIDGPPPPRPVQPVVSARQLAMFVFHSGRFVGDAPRPADLARFDIHRSTVAGFTHDGSTLVGTLPKEGGGLLIGADNQTYYVRIVAVSQAKTKDGGDIASAPTDEIAVLPLPATQIATGAIGAQQLAADIAFVSRLIVGDINAGHIEIDGRTGVTPSFLATDANLMPTFRIDAPSGDVFLRGQIRTADSGERLVWRESSDHDIRFYPRTGNRWASLYARTFTIDGIDYGGMLLQSAAKDSFRSFLWASPENVQIYRGADAGSIATAGLVVSTVGFESYVRAPGGGPRSTVRLSDFGFRAERADFAYVTANEAGATLADDRGSYFYAFRRTASILAGSQTWEFSTNVNNLPLFQSTSQNSAFEMGPNTFTAYKPSTGALVALRASNVTTTSARAGKTEIESLPFDPERVIVDAPAQMWERLDPGQTRDTPLARRRRRERGGRKDFGPMADDLPEVLQVPMTLPGSTEPTIGIDFGAQIAVVWAASAAHTARLDAITARLDALEAA